MKAYKHYKQDLKKFKDAIVRNQKQCDRHTAKGDFEVARWYEQDVKAMTDILNELNNNDFEYAFDLMYESDTAIRDQIPARLYNYLAKINDYN